MLTCTGMDEILRIHKTSVKISKPQGEALTARKVFNFPFTGHSRLKRPSVCIQGPPGNRRLLGGILELI